jgi:arsenate reductase
MSGNPIDLKKYMDREPPKKKRVLILCTGNSCRSQMAEGILRHYGKDRIEVASAGTQPSSVNPVAIQVMQEIGIDISGHRSKHLDELRGQFFDVVITVCDHARDACPVFPGGVTQLHWGFPDPPHHKEITDKVVDEFRRVRDMIHKKFKRYAESKK